MHEPVLANGGEPYGFLIFLGIVIISFIFDALKKAKTAKQNPSTKPPTRSVRPSSQGRPSHSPLGGPLSGGSAQRSAQPAPRPQSESLSPAEVLRRLMEDLTEAPRASAPPPPPSAALREEAERAERLKKMEQMARQQRAAQAATTRPAPMRPTQQELRTQRRQQPPAAAPAPPPQASQPAPAQPLGAAVTAVQTARYNASRMREALILSEILQPPLAMRGPGGRRPR